jgi:hypothetical protein
MHLVLLSEAARLTQYCFFRRDQSKEVLLKPPPVLSHVAECAEEDRLGAADWVLRGKKVVAYLRRIDDGEVGSTFIDATLPLP